MNEIYTKSKKKIVKNINLQQPLFKYSLNSPTYFFISNNSIMRIPLLFLFLSFTSIGMTQNNFRVQITGMETTVPPTYFTGLENVQTYRDQYDIQRYYLGDFETQAEAESTLQMVKEKGYNYAFVMDLMKNRAACECSKTNRFTSNIFFDFDRSDLRTVSREKLRTLADILQENPTYKVQLIGHTDGKGSDEYNIALSQRRANSAQKYLNNLGIAQNRISIEFNGKKAPIAINQSSDGKDNPQGRQFNRRVMVQITDANGTPLNSLVEEIAVPATLQQG